MPKGSKKKSGKPKRALAAYMFFQMERSPALKEKNPDLPQTEIFKLVGEQWRNATDKEKAPFVKRAENDKVRYSREMEEWEAQRAQFPDEDTDEDDGKKRKKKRKKDPAAPKRAKSGYLFFTQEKLGQIRAQNPGMAQKDIMKAAGECWKELPEAQKQKYHQRAQVDKERYEAEMSKYRG